MTLELTPDQHDDLIRSVANIIKMASEAKKSPSAKTNKAIKAGIKRLESLHDLLTHSTAVILYRP